MTSLDDIERLVKKIDVIPCKTMDRKTLTDMLDAQDVNEGIIPANSRPTTRRMSMHIPLIRYAAAAAILIGAFIGINQFGGPNSMAGVAWADIVTRTKQIEYAHVYYFKSRGQVLKRYFEAWQDDGNMVTRDDEGNVFYDDGQTKQGFDKSGKRLSIASSALASKQTVFEVYTAAFLTNTNEQFNQQTPTNIGDDFLIYEFDPPGDENKWLANIFIMVGKNSHLPIQVKVYHKDGDYDLIMFDYESPKKPKEFFEPPAVGTYNYRGEIVLDGEEMVVDLEGAQGLKQAILHLYDKYDGPVDGLPTDYRRPPFFGNRRKEYKKRGGPIFKLDVTFITDEGYRSQTNDIIVMRLNEAQQCGVGSEAGSGSLDDWPDGKYRNVRFSPILRATDNENTFILELSCWLKPK